MNYNLKYSKQNYFKKINYYNMPTKKINYFYIGHPVKILYFLIIKKKEDISILVAFVYHLIYQILILQFLVQ